MNICPRLEKMSILIPFSSYNILANVIIKEVSLTDYQNILVAIIFSSIILYPICLFFEFSSHILKFFSYGIYIFGVINIALLVRSLISKKDINFFFHKDLNYILFALIFVGLLFYRISIPIIVERLSA